MSRASLYGYFENKEEISAPSRRSFTSQDGRIFDNHIGWQRLSGSMTRQHLRIGGSLAPPGGGAWMEVAGFRRGCPGPRLRRGMAPDGNPGFRQRREFETLCPPGPVSGSVWRRLEAPGGEPRGGCDGRALGGPRLLHGSCSWDADRGCERSGASRRDRSQGGRTHRSDHRRIGLSRDPGLQQGAPDVATVEKRVRSFVRVFSAGIQS